MLHVLDERNDGYRESVPTPLRELGATVPEVWSRLRRHTDRFVPVNPAVFLDPEVTSPEYVSRYGRERVTAAPAA